MRPLNRPKAVEGKMYRPRAYRHLPIFFLLVLALALLPQNAYAAITTDVTTYGSGSGSSSSANLNHAANVLVVISVGLYASSTFNDTVTSVTVGGVSASFLGGTSQYGIVITVWHIFRASAANEAVSVTLTQALGHAWIATAFTGTRTSEPFFEGTNVVQALALSLSGTLAAGTTDRRVFYAIAEGIATTNGVTPGTGQAEISEVAFASNVIVETSYKDASVATTMSASITNPTQRWTGLVTGILPASASGVGTAAAIQLNSLIAVNFASSTTTLTAKMSYPANSLIVVSIGMTPGTNTGNTANSITIGGVAATFLGSGEVAYLGHRIDVWYLFSSTAASAATITVGSSAVMNVGWIATAFSGTRSSEPFFEGTNSVQTIGLSLSSTLAAGTTGRMIIFSAIDGTSTASVITPGGGQTEIGTATVASSFYMDCSYKLASAATTMSASIANPTQGWAGVVTGILPASATQIGTASAVTLINTVEDYGSGSTTAVLFHHKSSWLGVFAIAIDSNTITVTSLSVDGTSATYLTRAQGGETQEVWYKYMPSDAIANINVTLSSAATHELLISAYAGVKSSEPFFESTTTATAASALSVSVNVAAGTTGRRVLMAVTGSYSNTAISPGGSQVEIQEVDQAHSGAETNYRDISGAVTMSASWANPSASWATVATGILNGTIAYSLNLKVVQSDGATILASAQTTMNNGTDQVKTVSGGWGNYTGISAPSVTVKVKWENSWVNGTFTQTMGADRTITVVTKVYSSYTLAWRFNDNSTAFTPTQIQLLAPNSTLVTLTGGSVSSISLVQNGTWTVKQVSKWGNNVVAASNPTFVPTGNSQTRQMACRIYTITPVWKDNSGASLYAAISSYKITYPNSTLSGTLSSGTAYWIQNGTSTISAVTWKGTDVTPASATFSAESGSPTFNLKIYALKLKHQDNLSNLLTVGVQLTFPNSTTLTKTPSSGWTNMTQVQTGTITIVTPTTVSGTERYVLTSSSTISLTSSTTQTETWRHDLKSVVLSFKDNSGGTVLAPQPSSFTVTLSNSTSASNPTASSWICTGTTTLTAVTWEGTNVLPSGSPSVSVTAQTTYYYNVYVYSTTPVWKDSSGAALYAAISSYKITFPNATLSGTLSSGTAYWIQNGTSTISAVTWKGTDVTPASATFSAESGSPTFNLKIYALHIKNQDNLAISLAQNVQLTFPNATATTFTPISGWIDLLQVQTGTVTITTPITVSGTERYVLTNSSTISLTSSVTTTEVWRHDLKNVVLSAKDGTGTTILSPALSTFTVQLSNGTSIANPTAATWMATGTTTLTAATWEGSNVCNSATVSITTQTTYYFNVAVYSRSLTFRYNDGATTFVPTQVQFTAPNGTLITLTSYTAVLLQNGTSTITSITYWGNNVVAAVHPTFDVSTGNAWIDSRVYSITPVWKDSSGAALYSSPSSFKWTAPNATLSAALASGTAYWLQNGTSTISAVTWKGSNVTPSAGMTFDASTGSPTTNLRVYAFTMQGKDQSGYNIPSSFAITFPNATTTTFVGNSTGYSALSQVQNGSYTLNMIWNTLTVNGSLAQSITADKTLTIVGLVYYTATNSYRAAVSDGTLSNVVASDQAISFDATAIGLKTIKVHVPTKSLPQGVYIDGVLKTLNTDYTYDDATKLVTIPYGFSTHTFMITWQTVVSGPTGGGSGALTTTPTTPLEQLQKILEIAKGNPYIVGIIGMVGLFGGAGVAYRQDKKKFSIFLMGMGAVFTLNAFFFWNILPQQVLQTNLGGLLPLTMDKYLLPIPALELPTVAPTGQEITTWIMTLILLAAPIAVLAYVAIRE